MHLACRRDQDDPLKVKTSFRKWKKGDLSDFKHRMVVGGRQAGPSISETADRHTSLQSL